MLQVMTGRMPFPVPFLPAILVVMLTSWVGAKLWSCSNPEPTGKLKEKVGVQPHAVQGDPFPEGPGERARAAEATPVRITTKYVELGSGTEELKFDWIVEPKMLEGEK